MLSVQALLYFKDKIILFSLSLLCLSLLIVTYLKNGANQESI